jgi:hypothetical protein
MRAKDARKKFLLPAVVGAAALAGPGGRRYE